MKRELTVSAVVSFYLEVTVPFEGTKEEFAALPEEERDRLTFSRFEDEFGLNGGYRFKDGKLERLAVSEGEDDENEVEIELS